MADLISMKMSPKEGKKMAEPTCMVDNEYPYGLCLHLDENAIAKLGITELPDAGEVMLVMARATVQSVSMRDTQDGQDRCIDLQITDLALAQDKKEKSAEDTLYGG